MIELNEVLNYLDDLGIDYKYMGNENLSIKKYSSFDDLDSNCISWVKTQINYKEEVLRGLKNVLLVISQDVYIKEESIKGGVIICENPKKTFFSILNNFFNQETNEYSIGNYNSISSDAKIDKNVSIGNNCTIEKFVEIGEGTKLYNNIVIKSGVKIGKNCIIKSGAIIGEEGFGHSKNKDGSYDRILHLGSVMIGDNVDIGSNTCIDRGVLSNTIISSGSKVHNLCQIAHNVFIGRNCFIAPNTIIYGSVVVNDNCHIAGSMIKNQITIGKNVLVGMGSVVVKDVEDNKIVAGVPAKVLRDNS